MYWHFITIMNFIAFRYCQNQVAYFIYKKHLRHNLVMYIILKYTKKIGPT